MLEKELKITNKLGLHVRAATKFVQEAMAFDADISISCNDQTADAKSIMEVLMLAAIQHTVVVIRISGDKPEEEQEALERLSALVNDRFGECE
jgi:phosphocarrier protein HPr